jgi:hypothetical protein
MHSSSVSASLRHGITTDNSNGPVSGSREGFRFATVGIFSTQSLRGEPAHCCWRSRCSKRAVRMPLRRRHCIASLSHLDEGSGKEDRADRAELIGDGRTTFLNGTVEILAKLSASINFRAGGLMYGEAGIVRGADS